MNNLVSILKIKLITTLKLNKLFSQNKGRTLINIIVALGAGISILSVIGLYFEMIVRGLEQFGKIDLFLYIIPIGCMLFCFITSINKAQGVLFSSKDTELLTAMPIKESTILTSKILELLSLNYFFLLAILIPATVVYYYHVGGNLVLFLLLIVGIIFIPLLPIVLSAIIAIILGYVSSKFRFKNLVYIGLYIVLFGAIMLLTSKVQGNPEVLINESHKFIEATKTLCPPGYYFADMLINTSAISLMMLLLWSVIPFVCFIFVFKRIYKRVTALLSESYKGVKLKKINMETSSHIKSLFKKEVKRFLSSPLYVINSSFGVVVMIIFSGATIFGGKEMFLKLVELEGMGDMINLIVIVVLGISASIGTTTASSISLEGKNIWILKSMPIKPIDIFLAKGLLNFIIFAPFIVISSCIFAFTFSLGFMDVFWVVSIPMVALIVSTLGGLVINMNWPNLQWTNEVQVIKQGLSTFLSIMLGFVIVGAPVGTFILIEPTNITVFLSIVLLVLVILAFTFYNYLNTIESKKFNKL